MGPNINLGRSLEKKELYLMNSVHSKRKQKG